MSRNVEIKTRIGSVQILLPVARALADGDAGLIEQDDTIFAVPQRRLRLRQFANGAAKPIHDHRTDVPAARANGYMRR
jgi:hypothetical protein